MSVVRPAQPPTNRDARATLRANPCPEVTDPFCRLPLLTLFYRPEASHLGDLLRSWVRPTARARFACGRRIFKGRRGRTGRRTNGGALPGPRASRRLDRFQARAENPPSTRDDNSCRGPRRRLRRPLGRRRLLRWLDDVGSGISTRFPFTDVLVGGEHVPFRIDSPACDCR